MEVRCAFLNGNEFAVPLKPPLLRPDFTSLSLSLLRETIALHLNLGLNSHRVTISLLNDDDLFTILQQENIPLALLQVSRDEHCYCRAIVAHFERCDLFSFPDIVDLEHELVRREKIQMEGGHFREFSLRFWEALSLCEEKGIFGT